MNTLQKDADHSLRTLVKWQRLTAPGGAKFVAGLVLQAVEEGQAQYFTNDRLRKMAGAAA